MTECTGCLSPQLLAALSGWVNIAVIILIAVLTVFAALIGIVFWFNAGRDKELRSDINYARQIVEKTASGSDCPR